MYIQRELEFELKKLFKEYPVITLTGPRQSGKTTTMRNIFPELKYVSLENPTQRDFAKLDPIKFLGNGEEPMIIDEIQRVPELVSYIQGIVDDANRPGMFILSGSQQFELTRTISQSLAGRTAIMRLLPFTIDEAYTKKGDVSADQMMLHGFFPRIFTFNQNPSKFYANYIETYLRRDLNEFITIKDLSTFQKFVTLCAGRIGQLFVASTLANEVGVSVKTIQSWLSVLEASYIIFTLRPYHTNINKRLIKAPKIYFYDVGLATYLLGITTTQQLSVSPNRGNLFENMVVTEIKKFILNRGIIESLCFFRDSHHNEVDILTNNILDFDAIEIKSSETFSGEMFKGLNYLRKILPSKTNKTLLCYDGTLEGHFKEHIMVNYRNIYSEMNNLSFTSTPDIGIE